jgi:hypothetical protein
MTIVWKSEPHGTILSDVILVGRLIFINKHLLSITSKFVLNSYRNFVSWAELGGFCWLQAIGRPAGLCNVLMERQRTRVWTQTTFEKPNFQNHSNFDGKCLTWQSTVAMKYSKFLIQLFNIICISCAVWSCITIIEVFTVYLTNFDTYSQIMIVLFSL